MPDQKHLDLLKQGVEKWNQWRREYPNLRPNLNYASLRGEKLTGANFKGVGFVRSDLSNANLQRTDLGGANLFGADLSGADLSGADLSGANLFGTGLRDANLNGANLFAANFSQSDLTRANVTSASIIGTIFGDVDLHLVKGLEQVIHVGPSTVGIDTIRRSGGNIPEGFLRGIGTPDSFIVYARTLVKQSDDFYSCFISYSSYDQRFAEHLYNDLQGRGVRCWFAPEDLKIGDKIRPRIDSSIHQHDKLLLVLSEHSVASQWVEQEVETALAKERKEDRTVLFPLQLDKAVMAIDAGWPALIRNTRTIGDFTRWKRHDVYQQAFERLLRDLKSKP